MNCDIEKNINCSWCKSPIKIKTTHIECNGYIYCCTQCFEEHKIYLMYFEKEGKK
jgi:hypothetical protein